MAHFAASRQSDLALLKGASVATTDPRSATTPETLSRNALGARHIVFFVVAAAAPLGFAIGAIPLAIGRGGIGTAAMFIVTGVILLIFAVGYVAMAKHVRRAGGLYIYVTEGLGRTVGLGAAFLVTVAYAIAATGAVGVFAILAQALFVQFGLETPWVLWALIATVIMGALGILKVELNARVLGVIMICEVAILLAVGVAVVIAGGADGLSLAPFNPTEILAGNPGAMLAITIAAVLSLDLLKGVIVGIVVGVAFVLHQNSKGAVVVTREPHQVRLRFRRDGTFVSKPGIVAALEEVQDGDAVVIDATGEFIDHDVKELVASFIADAQARRITVTLRGLDLRGVQAGGGH